MSGPAVDAVYRAVQAEIDARRPACAVSGRCCRFEEYGHRLYVTTLELAAFVAATWGSDPNGAWDGTGCPFQRSKLCTVHAIRPFGCRMFFCDATSTEWQNDAYERFHARLKAAARASWASHTSTSSGGRHFGHWAWQPSPPRRPCLSCNRTPGCLRKERREGGAGGRVSSHSGSF